MKKLLLTIALVLSILKINAGTPQIYIWDLNNNYSTTNGCLAPTGPNGGDYILNVNPGQVIDIGVKFNNNGNATVPNAQIFFFASTGSITSIYSGTYTQLQALPTYNGGCSPDWLSTINCTIPSNAPLGMSKLWTTTGFVYVNVVSSVDIKEIENKPVIESIKYFDILGQEVKEPVLGVIYISKATYTNGSVETKKVVIQ